MTKKRQLTDREVISALKAMGFTMKPTTATSHSQWVKEYTDKKGNPTKKVVTVDKSKSPFSHDLIKSMASQAGLSPRQFTKICTEKSDLKKAKKGLLSWLPWATAPQDNE